MVRARIELRPSRIRYTQDSIKNTFTSQHDGILIGKTLDYLCNGVCDVSDIPPISVFFYKGHYWSADNRRLWVFRQFERLGGCEKILVKEIDWNRMNFDKFTTESDGLEVRVRGYRGDPGGTWYMRPDNFLRSQKQSSRHGRHGRPVHSFDGRAMATAAPQFQPLPPPTTARQPARGKPVHQAYKDYGACGQGLPPVSEPVRPANPVLPRVHVRAPTIEHRPSYSPSGYSSSASGRANTARDVIIDVAPQTPWYETYSRPVTQPPGMSKKECCCTIS